MWPTMMRRPRHAPLRRRLFSPRLHRAQHREIARRKWAMRMFWAARPAQLGGSSSPAWPGGSPSSSARPAPRSSSGAPISQAEPSTAGSPPMIGTTEPSSPTAWPLSVRYPGSSAGGEVSGSSSDDAGLVGSLPVMLTISFGDHVHGLARQRLIVGDAELLAAGRCRELVRQAGRIAVLAEDKAAVAESRGAGEDHG